MNKFVEQDVYHKSLKLSSTALYTAYVWKRNQLTDIDLAQTKGFWFYQTLRPFNWLARTIKGTDLETILLQRHQIIDSILEHEIKSGKIKQVVELASGFSPRGHSFVSRFGQSHQLKYIETDLAPQISAKRLLLQEKTSIDFKHHLFMPIDAFANDGFSDLREVLDLNVGTAIITEGLLNYFPTELVHTLWMRIQNILKDFKYGIYLADTQTHSENLDHPLAKIIVGLIRQSSKTPFYLHYSNADQLREELIKCNFSNVEVILPQNLKVELNLPGSSKKDMVNIIYAKQTN